MEVFEMCVWLWVVIISGISSTKAYESGIYVDNVFTRRTEMVNKLEGGSKRAIKQEILSLLGLHHTPKHVPTGKHNSAPSYMLDLYRTLQNDVIMEVEDDSQWMYRIKQEILNKNLTLPGMEDNVEQADMIMSFVNRGEYQWGQCNAIILNDALGSPTRFVIHLVTTTKNIWKPISYFFFFFFFDFFNRKSLYLLIPLSCSKLY